MAYPKFKPDYKGKSRVKLISKKIKMLKKEGKPQKQAVAMAFLLFSTSSSFFSLVVYHVSFRMFLVLLAL